MLIKSEFTGFLRFLTPDVIAFALLLCGIVLASGVSGKEPMPKRIDYYRFKSTYISSDSKKCSRTSLLLDVSFKDKTVQLRKTLFVYGAHAPVVQEMRVERTSPLPPELATGLLKALNAKDAASLTGETQGQETPPWWCTKLWTTYHPDPLHDEPGEYFCWGDSGNCKEAAFCSNKFPAGRIALRSSTMYLLQELKIYQAPRDDEVYKEEGDDHPVLAIDLKELLKNMDKYKGRRLSVVGWPVMKDHPGSFPTGLSPRGPFFVGLASEKASAKEGSRFLPVCYLVSSVARPDLIKPNWTRRLCVEGVLSRDQQGGSQAPCLIRATRVEPAP